MISQLKDLQDENRRLKKMYAEAQLSADLLKGALSNCGEAISAPRDGVQGRRGRQHQHRPSLSDVWRQSELLALPGQS